MGVKHRFRSIVPVVVVIRKEVRVSKMRSTFFDPLCLKLSSGKKSELFQFRSFFPLRPPLPCRVGPATKHSTADGASPGSETTTTFCRRQGFSRRSPNSNGKRHRLTIGIAPPRVSAGQFERSSAQRKKERIEEPKKQKGRRVILEAPSTENSALLLGLPERMRCVISFSFVFPPAKAIMHPCHGEQTKKTCHVGDTALYENNQNGPFICKEASRTDADTPHLRKIRGRGLERDSTCVRVCVCVLALAILQVYISYSCENQDGF